MSAPTFAPGDLPAVLDHLERTDPAGALPRCEIRDVRLGRHRTEEVADVVADLLGRRAADAPRPVVALLVDATPIRRGHDDVKALVVSRLGERFDVRTQVLVDDHPVLHVDERSIATATEAATGADAVVTVGGGTITDIGKLASEAAGHLPLVVVQTAASVDGFTDDVSVVLRAGVKRTVPSRWPDVVVADVDTISQAPARMNRAGFGELTSMFVAPADWRLAYELGVDRTYRDGPIQLLEAVGRGMHDWAPGIATADVDATTRLTWALDVRGIVTGIAGTTAVLSGVEHLVSHVLDLHHSQLGLPMGLHGEQVGAAAVVAASAWEMLLERLSEGVPALALPDEAAARAAVDAAFAPVDASGRIRAECWSDYSRKLSRFAGRQPQVEAVLADWPATAGRIQPLLRHSADIASQLRAAGAAARLEELQPSVSGELAEWAVGSCALMRNRFTVVDLLTWLGWWGPDDVQEVLHRADAVTAPRSGVGAS